MIRFSRQHIEAIKKHGERDYPHECCGLLIGMVLEQGDKRVMAKRSSVAWKTSNRLNCFSSRCGVCLKINQWIS